MTRQPYVRALALVVALGAWAPLAHAAGTAAGTDITNVAEATYKDPDGNDRVARSNPSVVRVDELLDATVALNDAGNVTVASPQSNAVLSFTLTNTGNGPEAFRLSFDATLGGDQFDPTNVRLFLDSDGNGLFDPLVDTAYVASANDPLLAADQSVTVFLVGDIPAAIANNSLALSTLAVEAVTVLATSGADAPGTNFAGAGANGSAAVVGNSGADATGQNAFIVANVAASLAKTQVIVDPFGGSNPVPGATITYTLNFTASGTGTLTNLLITDPIPAGTTYVPGSLKLNGAALTDTSDTDIGRFTGSGIDVNIGSVTAPSSSVITFDVTIN